MDLILNNNNKDLTEWVLPWVETYFKRDANGYVCKLERRDNPNFIEYFKTEEDMWDRIEEIEINHQYPPKMEVVKHE